jgi:hypothetical protein
MTVCVGDIWKMVNLVLDLWLEAGRSGFSYDVVMRQCQSWSLMVCPGLFQRQWFFLLASYFEDP